MLEKLDQLKARRAQLTETMDRLPAGDSERCTMQAMVETIDQVLARAAKRSTPAPPRRAAVKPTAAHVLARIPKGDRAELRISVKTWRGRRTVDLRLYFKPEGSDDLVPSRKGVSFDASKLDALLDGLMLAQQHMPTDRVEP